MEVDEARREVDLIRSADSFGLACRLARYCMGWKMKLVLVVLGIVCAAFCCAADPVENDYTGSVGSVSDQVKTFFATNAGSVLHGLLIVVCIVIIVRCVINLYRHFVA